MKTPRFEYVYAIKSTYPGSAYYKIGRTTNIKSRLGGLQTSNPFRLELLCAIRTYESIALEQTLHKELSEFRCAGEWFAVDEKIVLDAFSKYGENLTMNRWLMFFDTLGVQYSTTSVINQCVRLKKEDAFFVALDYVPNKSQMLDYADFSAKSSAVVVATSLPNIYFGNLGYLTSGIFLHVFAGTFTNVYDCAMCNVHLTEIAFDPVFGRYRKFDRCGFSIDGGVLKIEDDLNNVPVDVVNAAQHAMSLPIESNFISIENR